MCLKRCSVGCIRGNLTWSIVLEGSFNDSIQVLLSKFCFLFGVKCLFDSLSGLFLGLFDWNILIFA